MLAFYDYPFWFIYELKTKTEPLRIRISKECSGKHSVDGDYDRFGADSFGSCASIPFSSCSFISRSHRIRKWNILTRYVVLLRLITRQVDECNWILRVLFMMWFHNMKCILKATLHRLFSQTNDNYWPQTTEIDRLKVENKSNLWWMELKTKTEWSVNVMKNGVLCGCIKINGLTCVCIQLQIIINELARNQCDFLFIRHLLRWALQCTPVMQLLAFNTMLNQKRLVVFVLLILQTDVHSICQ